MTGIHLSFIIQIIMGGFQYLSNKQFCLGVSKLPSQSRPKEDLNKFGVLVGSKVGNGNNL